MRKNKKKITLSIFMVLVLVIGALLSQYRESANSILLGIRAGKGQIQKLRDENQTQLVENVNEFMEKPLREMTDEEKAKLETGESTANEIYKQMFEEKISGDEDEKASQSSSEKTPEIKTETGKKPATEGKKPQDGTASQNTANSSTDKDLLVSEAMVKLYVLQNEFNARAEATIKEGDSYYMSIRKHPQDPEARSQTIAHFTPIVRGIERDCDAKVDKVIIQLEKDLKSMGADASICATIRATYENEKQLKLSYYTNKYLR